MRGDIAFEDSDLRCRWCSKRLQVDLGGDVLGNASAGYFCPGCGVVPQSPGWELDLLAAVSTVVSRRTPS